MGRSKSESCHSVIYSAVPNVAAQSDYVFAVKPICRLVAFSATKSSIKLDAVGANYEHQALSQNSVFLVASIQYLNSLFPRLSLGDSCDATSGLLLCPGLQVGGSQRLSRYAITVLY